jgi:hypothetical protein
MFLGLGGSKEWVVRAGVGLCGCSAKCIKCIKRIKTIERQRFGDYASFMQGFMQA